MVKHQLNQNMRLTGTKARLQRKLEERRQAQAQQVQQTQAQQAAGVSDIKFDGKSFSDGSKVKRSKTKKGKKK